MSENSNYSAIIINLNAFNLTVLLIVIFSTLSRVFLLLFILICIVILSLILARETLLCILSLTLLLLGVVTVYINFILDVKLSQGAGHLY